MVDKLSLLEALQERNTRQSENKLFYKYFQNNTAFSIENYNKHFEFFQKGRDNRQVMFIAGNRVGKTESGGLFELVCHAVGWYPSWWPGHRFPPGKNLTIWACGDTRKTCRDILQKKLLGESLSVSGTGLIPKKYIKKLSRQGGTAEAVDTIYVDKIGGGESQIVIKSYDAGRDTFQGTEVDFILLDEEPILSIFVECLMRTMTCAGKIRLTLTPLMGLTELIKEFLEADKNVGKAVVTATWDDVPHLTKKDKDELLASIPEFQRDARTKGIPQLGSGAVYRVSLDDVIVQPFEIPKFWKKTFGLDVGYNNTAAIWAAINPDNGVVYLYDEMLAQLQQPHEYARTMKLRGDWIKGVIDPAGNNATQADGEKIMQMLIAEGIKLEKADNSVEAGIYLVWQMLSTGKLKIFSTCEYVLKEYRVYQRDEKGKIVKKNDHFMDALRYCIMSGLKLAKSEAEMKQKAQQKISGGAPQRHWMG